MLHRLNPFARVVVRNTDADEAGDYRIAFRWEMWFGRWPGFMLVGDLTPADLD